MSLHSEEIGGYTNDTERCAECGKVYEGPCCTCTPRPKPLDAFLARCVRDSIEGYPQTVVAEVPALEHPMADCRDCDGEGWWEVGEPTRRMTEDGQVIQRRREDCPYCKGKGKR